MSDFPRITFSRYHFTDWTDPSSDPIYLGYLDKDGNWYIKEINKGNRTVRYEVGNSNYTTNWTGRTGLTYGYFDAEF